VGNSALPAQKKKAHKVSPVRQTALAYLNQVVDELRSVEDLSERTAISRDVVKILAARNRERCQSLLDALFADVLKAADVSGGGESAQQKKADSLIREVIKMAASFDSNLADSYVTRYAESKQQISSPSPSTLYTHAEQYDGAEKTLLAYLTLPGAGDQLRARKNLLQTYLDQKKYGEALPIAEALLGESVYDGTIITRVQSLIHELRKSAPTQAVALAERMLPNLFRHAETKLESPLDAAPFI
jgi:hypothetical protein